MEAMAAGRPVIATAIAVLAPPPETFRKARDFAAWLGLVPRQHSTGGKQRLGATTRMGERSLRRLFIIGANSVIIKRHVHAAAKSGTWLGGMLIGLAAVLLLFAFLHYTLPQHDIVRIVGTENRRVDIGDNSIFWSRAEVGMADSTSLSTATIFCSPVSTGSGLPLSLRIELSFGSR